MDNGWIKVNRKLLDHKMWNTKPFSKGQAWMELILLANYEDKEVLIGNQIIEIKRGQFITSILKLSKRWGWSRHKISDFFLVLKQDAMSDIKRTTKYALITIVNYDLYQSLECEKDNKRTTKGQQKDNKRTQLISKEDKEDKEEHGISAEAPKEKIDFRQKKFYNEIAEKVISKEITKEMAKSFFEYWSEHNPSKTKMRFELEKTWNLPARLRRWNANIFLNRNPTKTPETKMSEKDIEIIFGR